MPSRLRRRPGYKTRPGVMELSRELGLLRSRDLEAHGVPRTQLRLMLSLGSLREVAPGVWAHRYMPPDAVLVAAKRVPRGVLCLKSALWLHGLLPEEPAEVWMAIGERARKPRWSQPPLHVARFSGPALSEGIEHRTFHGVSVRVYGVAKTIADLFKYRNKLGYPVAVRALRAGLLSGRCSEEDVLRFAAICRVGKSVAPYLEVIRARKGRELDLLAAQRASGTSAQRPEPWLTVPGSGPVVLPPGAAMPDLE
ncbi:type IV toxin-antitoxin system AbiEi family antitoxin domain-containing protein [Pyxidicoccus xibeiensis]|uniref:type IV toxin-antitoxin system AbiEi family antitoxin domain-containing protein n=1 Tax=Pyxidicoccus xibeiensis TaxID=2906759 RepID=UPI0020A7949A|nr:type IV toxin-antitoxin system AbiEi family antitoxin domain-containing protein [Pyxidicoccus xibeiensis]MCP3136126.1 type IV toxin-antitoxin system AbiEi family antitoxin domain-containing protein [Pyxidicoccus xibeiensis]